MHLLFHCNCTRFYSKTNLYYNAHSRKFSSNHSFESFNRNGSNCSQRRASKIQIRDIATEIASLPMEIYSGKIPIVHFVEELLKMFYFDSLLLVKTVIKLEFDDGINPELQLSNN